MEEFNFIEIAKKAKAASKKLATLSTDIKNQALLMIAESLENNKDITIARINDFNSFITYLLPFNSPSEGY